MTTKKTYQVTLVYTTYVNYEIEAESEEQATEMAWHNIEQSPPDLTYGNWETCDITELDE